MFQKINTWQDSFNNNIDLWCYPNEQAKDNILLVARFHGDEPEGEFCLEQILKVMKEHFLF